MCLPLLRRQLLNMSYKVLLCTAVVLAAAVSADKPNIVVLFADDLGFGDLAVYGHPTSTTPNLDKMAKEGLVFTQFYSASPVCSPSRVALLTGRYQTRSGIWPGVFGAASTGGIPHNETTSAEVLKQAGYATAIVGKWHLGVGKNQTYLPTNHGFDYYMGIPYSHDMCPCLICFYPNQACFDKCRTGDTPCPIFENTRIIKQPADFTTLTATYTNAATSFIQKNAAGKTPFYLYLAYQHTHHPQFASKEFRNSSIRGTFGDSLSELDWSVGEVFKTLESSGVADNTFVFFTSDNGPSLTRQIRGGNQGLLKCGKGTTYEGGMREPAIAWMPGKVTPGRTMELAATVDVFVTISKMGGGKIPTDRPIDGVDMAPILFNNEKSNRDFYYYYPFGPNPDDGVFATRYKQYKAHFYTKGGLAGKPYRDEDCWGSTPKTKHDPPLLFDLVTDPSERHPLSGKVYEEIIKQITDMTMKFNKEMTWHESEIHGSNSSAMPCCKPGCSPFPTCCACGQEIQQHLFSPALELL
ncbi:arylsulfatase A-like [Corticium candelabrum]|uniref:arylsulfatase A-like n=1 Tax=Corticium candelabrum TaxID=121492 RepID=UPI002E260CA5|nr:arylsulfatase A-like [Corticium candelabrum]